MSSTAAEAVVMCSLEEQFERIRSHTKFSSSREDYLQKRRAFAQKIGFPELWNYIDHFALYAGTQTIGTRLAVYEILKQCLDVPGHIAEFGVWNGANLLWMAKILEMLRPRSLKQVFGFDNFDGIVGYSDQDRDRQRSYEHYCTGKEDVLRAAIELYGMQDWVHLVKGDARETIPAFEQAFPDALFSLAYIDFDLYEPCKAALAMIGKRLSPGGIVAFDEALTNQWQGEGLALVEFLQECAGTRFEAHSTLASQPTVYLVKQS